MIGRQYPQADLENRMEINEKYYRIFTTIRRTKKQLIFSKTDSAPCSPVRLIYVSNC